MMEEQEDHINIYKEILKLPTMSIRFESFTDLATLSIENPEEILKDLLLEHQYNLALNWITLNGYSERFSSQIILISILNCLVVENPDFIKAESLLNNIKNNECEDIIEFLLNKTIILESRKFVISYALQKASCNYNILHLWALKQELMGIILIENADQKSNQSQLLSLVNRPSLIIEQWIMNLKLTNISKGLQNISSILNSVECQSITKNNKSSTLGKGIDCLCWEHYHLILENYAFKALKLSSSQISVQKVLVSELEDSQFIMPHLVPSKSDWQKNSSVSKCPVCKLTVFSIFYRKHHCRRCGRVVCAECSVFRHIVDSYGDSPVRVCEFCYRIMTENHSRDYEYLINIELSSENESENSDDIPTDSNIAWYFTTDSSHNQLIREEFSFDYTPSLYICHTLYTLHKDDMRAALSILKLCHKTFEKVINSFYSNSSYIDPSRTLKIIQTFLSSAKVRFGKLLNIDGISVCEYYKQWIIWLQILLYSHNLSLLPKGTLINIIEIGEIRQLLLVGGMCEESLLVNRLKQEKIHLRILRDNLVKNEKWDFALDISTKEGFDKQGIWGAYGISSLKSGDFRIAREQFDKVLRKPKNKYFKNKIALLDEIIFILENNKFAKGNEKNLLEEPLNALENKLNKDFNNLQSPNLKECNYYLRLYGSHSSYLQFLVRHQQLLDSVIYCKEMDIKENLFSDCVILPVFKLGYLEELLLLLQKDENQAWSSGLIYRTCGFLDKLGYFSCLLEIQKYVKDNLRSSMTLVKMFKQNAITYSELLVKNSYLKQAMSLLNSYLESSSDQNIMNTNLKVPQQFSDIPLSTDCKYVRKQLMLIDGQFYLTDYLSSLEKSGINFKSKIRLVRELINKQRLKDYEKIERFAISEVVPTLFEKDDRLAICVILLGLELDFQGNLSAVYELVENKFLNARELLSTALQMLIIEEEFQNISNLIEGILNWRFIPDAHLKDCFWPALTMEGIFVPEQTVKEMIKFLKEARDKMYVCIEVGLLKLAFSYINNIGTAEDAERLQKIAKEKGDRTVVQFCTKWLQNFRRKRRTSKI